MSIKSSGGFVLQVKELNYSVYFLATPLATQGWTYIFDITISDSKLQRLQQLKNSSVSTATIIKYGLS